MSKLDQPPQLEHASRAAKKIEGGKIEEYCEEAFLREFAVQLISLLPFKPRLAMLLGSPSLLLHYFKRQSLSDFSEYSWKQCVPMRSEKAEDDELLSRNVLCCIDAERRLVEEGHTEKLTSQLVPMIQAADRSRWDEFAVQLVAEMPWYKWFDRERLKPRFLLDYLLRVRRVQLGVKVSDLPGSPVLGLLGESCDPAA